MRLSDGLHSRDNNYNLIRLLAAFAVLISHAFTVVTGDADLEPLRTSLGLTYGSIAVDVFFIVSGLLVTSSMRRSDSAVDFLIARFLRIWPGLCVSLVVLVVAASSFYWKTVDPRDAAHYVLRNSIPVGQLAGSIKGVFVGNPAGSGFNASLWTLPIEVRMYRNIFAIWVVSFLFFRHRRPAFNVMILLVAMYFAFKYFVLGEHTSVEAAPYRLPYMFFLGAAGVVAARRISLEPVMWLLAFFIILVSAALGRLAFFFSYSLLLWYVVLGAAYLVGGRVLAYNRVGDYSYGVYIYAWPVQQFAMALWPNLKVHQHIMLTGPVILACAVASWHAVESPSLRLKKRWVKWHDERRHLLGRLRWK